MRGIDLHLVLLLADAFMVGVICCVQWIIYPSFQQFERPKLVSWHQLYSNRIAAIVIPPMGIQLLGGSWRFWMEKNVSSGIYLGIILILWAITFIKFVPLHGHIGSGSAQMSDLQRLVRLNGVRTLLWIFVFVFNLKLWLGPY